MKEAIWKIHEYHDTFRWVVFIGDTHVGHERFDETGLRKLVRKIARSKSYRVIIMGDIVEMAVKRKMTMEQRINTRKQMKLFREIITPIADKVIAVLRGNHEERITEIDLIEESLMPHLPNAVYLGYEGFIRVGNGQSPASLIYCHHGDGGSQDPKYFIEQKIFKVGVQAIADVIAVGHIHKLWHEPYYIPEVHLTRDLTDTEIRLRKVTCVRTGHFLTDAQYARRAAYRISPAGAVRYDLNRREIDYV